MRTPRSTLSLLAGLAVAATSCGTGKQTETAASPVTGASRSTETLRGERSVSFDRQGEDGTIVRRLVAPVPAVWDALVAALSARAPKLTVLDRAVGGVGDTSLVLLRRWNGLPVSRYLRCGSTLTGAKADEERVRTVFLAQIGRLRGDTVAVSMHLSGGAEPLNSGNSGQASQCTTTGPAGRELIEAWRGGSRPPVGSTGQGVGRLK